MAHGTLLGTGDREHLAKSILLEESGGPLIARAVIAFAALAVLAFLVWASLAPVDEVAIAPGEIVPYGEVQQVQSLPGGIVREILVADGDTVAAGQVLMRLDPTLTRSEWAQSQAALIAAMARRERLQALLDGRAPDFAGLGSAGATAAADEQRLHDQILLGHQTRVRMARQQQAQAQAEAEELKARAQTLRQQKALLDEEIGIRQGLVEKGLNSRVMFLGLQRSQASLAGDLAGVAANQTRAAARLAEVTDRLREIDQQFREGLLTELASTHTELLQAQEQVTRSQVYLQLQDIVAPVGGIAHGLKAHTLGGIVAPGSTVLEIVPVDRRLIAQVRIAARDAGHIHTGQPVVLKLTTYDFGRYGGIRGVLEEISATAIAGPGAESHYRGRVSVDQRFVGQDPTRNPVLPGMSLQADIRTGSKTVMQYLLKPIYASAQQAMHER